MTEVELNHDIPMSLDPVDVEQEETLIDEDTQKNYRVWKKNAPFLYDYLSTNSLLWPSLTVQFFPDSTTGTSSENSDKSEDVYLQRLLHGTFSLGQSVDSISILQVPIFSNLNSHIKINKLDYNAEKEEFELATSSNNKLKVLQKINHLGDVNKVRYMPQKPNIIASANNLGDLVIYERTKHKSFKNSLIDDTNLNKVQLRLKNKRQEANSDIFAIDWNKQKEGTILSADMNGTINLFDIKDNYSKDSSVLYESWSYENNGIGINDIEWVPNHDSIFCSVDDKGYTSVFDTRISNALVSNNHSSDIGVNSISINPGITTCIATGDSKGSIFISDIRNFGHSDASPIYSIENQHKDSITQIKWHPKYHNVLGSSSTDHSVKLFDLAVENSDSSLLFIHAGHMLGVNDFDWSHHDDWLISSVADDNSLHLWKPTHKITNRFDTI
ncbi:chromatin assembly complex, subunit 3 [Scheffersomyces xylosifermentans]|uniref:chromatin assembly complex, subunit 3 n=1 Tax=Scheffersomyces xylosifermentans TaxID=1304137 RepID=UPI00315CBFF7